MNTDLSICRKHLNLSPAEYQLAYNYLEHQSEEPPSVFEVLDYFYAIEEPTNPKQTHLSPEEFATTYRYLQNEFQEPPSVFEIFKYAYKFSKKTRYPKPRRLK